MMKPATCARNSRLAWVCRLNGRFLLACVLAFAIPLQAIASTRMLACGPNHHRISNPGMQTAKSVEILNPQAVAAHMHEHGVSHCVEPGSDEPPSWNSAHQGGQSKCNSCAPCCTATALISEMEVLLEISLLNMDFPAVLPLQWPALVNTLERPPRARLD